MKKYLFLFIAIIAISGIAFANQGFHDTTSITTIKEALKMTDNSYVTVQGNIVKRLSEDTYLFKDNTGDITVEIDEHKWMGQSVTPQDKLELTGEIEKSLNEIKIDVKTVNKIK